MIVVRDNTHTHMHTHSHFMALFLGLPGWSGARRNLLLDFMVQGEISEADTLTIRLGATPSGLISNPPPSSPHFCAGCPSCHNPPNLSWHKICWLAYPVAFWLLCHSTSSAVECWLADIFTFHVRCSRGGMYIGHGRLCVCLSVHRRIPTLLHGPICNSREW